MQCLVRSRSCEAALRAASRPGNQTASRLHKLLPPIALRVEQRGEVAEIDSRMSGRGNRRLGVIGDAEAGALDHAEIVGAIADYQRVEIIQIEGFAQFG